MLCVCVCYVVLNEDLPFHIIIYFAMPAHIALDGEPAVVVALISKKETHEPSAVLYQNTVSHLRLSL